METHGFTEKNGYFWAGQFKESPHRSNYLLINTGKVKVERLLFTPHRKCPIPHGLSFPPPWQMLSFLCLLRSFTFPQMLYLVPRHSNRRHFLWAPKILHELVTLYLLKFIRQMANCWLEPHGESVKLSSVKSTTTFMMPLFLCPTASSSASLAALLWSGFMNKSVSHCLLEVLMEDQRHILHPAQEQKPGSSRDDFKKQNKKSQNSSYLSQGTSKLYIYFPLAFFIYAHTQICVFVCIYTYTNG